jgi:hypothetical protein
MEASKHNRTRRQHIVPSWYLDGFCDASGQIYVYEKGKLTRHGIPDKECAERDFYEFDLAGTKTKNSYENWLSRIESDAKGVFPSFVEGRIISSDQAAIWSCFVASLFWRTRKVRSDISERMLPKLREETKTEEFLRETQYAAFKKGEFYFAEELREKIDAFQKKYEDSHHYHIAGMPRHTRGLAEILVKKNWHTVSAPSGKFFVTSDCPVVTVERKEHSWELGAGFEKDNVMVFLPLTPERIFIAASSSFGFKATLPDAAADALNAASVRFAQRNVYADQDSPDLKTRVDLEINQIVFGKNAFLV